MTTIHNALALAPWLLIWNNEEAHLVLRHLGNHQIVYCLVNNRLDLEKSIHEMIVKRLREVYEYKPYLAGSAIWGPVTHKNAFDILLIGLSEERTQEAVEKYLSWAMQTDAEIKPMPLTMALRAGKKSGICVQAAHFFLENRPEVLQSLFEKGYEHWLCVDADSFRKIIFLYCATNQQTRLHAKASLLLAAAECCPREAENHIGYFDEHFPPQHLWTLLQKIKLPKDLKVGVWAASMPLEIMCTFMPEREKVLPENLEFFDNLMAKAPRKKITG